MTTKQKEYFRIFNKEGAVLIAHLRKDGTLKFDGIGKFEVEKHFKTSKV